MIRRTVALVAALLSGAALVVDVGGIPASATGAPGSAQLTRAPGPSASAAAYRDGIAPSAARPGL
jgi:hypothetical protein